MFSGKNMVIVVLVGLLALTLLGINLLTIFGNLFQGVGNLLKPLVGNTLGVIGYTSGTIINDTADAASSIAKGGVDIADGVAHSIGDLLKNSTPSSPDLAKTVNKGPSEKEGPSPKYNQPMPDKTTSTIQQPITAAKQNWCLVGDFNGQRGCIAVEDAGKCMSGQVFPSQQLCLNPTFTQNNPYG
jgi:hypothetical protein